MTNYDLWTSEHHEDKFWTFMALDKTDKMDKERQALFYMLASQYKFTDIIDDIYDFEASVIHLDVFDKHYFSGTEKRMLQFAFHLFTGFMTDLVDLLNNADSRNYEIVLNAIEIRFGRKAVV